jgi:septal ring factor EnvC (AmiA/AmiB activator)
MPSPTRFPGSPIRVLVAGIALVAVTGWGGGPAVAAVPAAPAASAGPAGETGAPQARRDLEALRREIVQLESRLRATQVRTGDSGAAVARLGVELSLQRQRLAEAAAARELAEGAVATTEGALRALAQRRLAQEKDLRRAVLALYRLGRNLPLRALLSIDTSHDVLTALRLLRYLARSNRQALSRMRETRQELEDRRRELVARREEAARWLARERQRLAELAAARRRQSEILATTREEGERLSGLAQELTLRRGRLEKLIDLVAAGAGDLEGSSIHEFRGALAWPAGGRIQTEFGPRKDARYGTIVPHHGVELAVAAGTEVRAIYAGRVLYAGAFEDVENLVVVRHPGQVLTLYGGLASVRVSRDDVVALDAVLGNSSETLYVEVRVGQRAEDPRAWLRGTPAP